MSKLPLSPWNHLCWPEQNIKFNIEELLHIYNTVFSKYERVHQMHSVDSLDVVYKGVGFQGLTDLDHTTSVMRGNIYINPETGKKNTYTKENLGNHLEYQRTLNVRHRDLCVGEFGRILDYLEDLGYHTHRGRIMELGPQNHKNWHVDSYKGLWGNNLRVHVPLITNSKCYLQWHEKDFYNFNPAADGTAYWVNTDVTHQYLNLGETWRVHIVVDLIKK